MHFEWDPKKEEQNRQKHKVSFAEATTVFDDVKAVVFDDLKHSIVEPREIILGMSILKRILLVSFTERHSNLRIISARIANKNEREKYQVFLKARP
jgi:uncharacterized DUF497 family protein